MVRRRSLSPAHLLALQEGRRRWLGSNSAQNPEPPNRNDTTAARAALRSRRERTERINARRRENLQRARETRNRNNVEPVQNRQPEHLRTYHENRRLRRERNAANLARAREIRLNNQQGQLPFPIPDPEPDRIPRQQPEWLRRYWERDRERYNRRLENLSRAREARRAKRPAVIGADLEQRTTELMRSMMEEMTRELIRPINTAEDHAEFSNATQFLYKGSTSEASIVEQLLRTQEGTERVNHIRDNLYNMLAHAMEDVLSFVEGMNRVYGTTFVFMAKRVGSDRWCKVTPRFIANTRDVVFDEHSPYTHLVDWTLNGSKTELLQQTQLNIPFPAPIIFQIWPAPRPRRDPNRARQGSWAPWKNAHPALDLTKYQIDNEGESVLNDDDAKEHCFIYALRMSGKVDEELLNHISADLYGRSTTMCSLKTLCLRFSINVNITVYTNSINIIRFGPRDGEPINMGLFDEHYFLDDKINVSKWVLDNPEEAEEIGPLNNIGWAYKRNEGSEDYIRDAHPIQKTGQVLKAMKERGLLIPIHGNDPHALTRKFYTPKILNENDLRYCSKFCKPIEPKQPPERPFFLWFADFESTTNGETHLPYMLCAVSEQNKTFESSIYTTTVENVESLWSKVLLSFTSFIVSNTPQDHTIAVYFHNLNYDMTFILPFIPTSQTIKITEVNNRIIGFRWFCPLTQRSIHFRDSYAMISAPLRDFGKMFGLNIEKEIFPYNYYTTTNFETDNVYERPTPSIDKYLSYYSDPEELETKLRHLGFIGPNNTVYAHGYSRYYCMRDCEVLRDGFKVFRNQLKEVTGLDCAAFLTLPSIAYNFLSKSGVFEGCFNLSGSPLFFIRKCVLGGRCMLQRNLKQDVSGEIADFDAVSLYPSAMARLYTLKGLPKIIDGPKRDLSFLQSTDGFFAEVSISHIGRELDFPLLAKVNTRGVMEYTNTPGVFYIDDISLSNAIKAHRIDPQNIIILRGYYYDQGKNYKIREVINHLFNQRLKLKREGNPLEQAYKLLMNSCYGKSIMKPITTENLLMNADMFYSHLLSSRCETLSFKPAGSRFLVTMSKNIISAQGFPSFGVHILAMSKVIMSEVMVLAQIMGIDVYYTDTDSIHLDNVNITRLANAYREEYGRELIGKNMGQFHTDFPNHPSTGLPTMSRRFIGVGKKAYVDELIDPTGEICYHTRLKGIPSATIMKTADKDYNGDVIGLYKDLYDGKAVYFDLLDGRVSFVLNNNLSYVTRTEFSRTVRFVE